MIDLSGLNMPTATNYVYVRLKNSIRRFIALKEMIEGHIELGNLPNGVYFLDLLDCEQ